MTDHGKTAVAETVPVVHIVDDDAAVRDSLLFLLAPEPFRLHTYPSGPALLAAHLPEQGCVLIDFQMPDMDGLQLQQALAERGIRLPVIVMTGHGDVPAAVRAMRAGAVDFLEKPFDEAQLRDAIRRALARNAQSLARMRATAAAALLIAQLTPREREVLDLLAAGRSSKEIALVLGTSPRTIDVHRARVFQKLHIDTLPDLVHVVLAAALQPPPGAGQENV
jgi:two-component system response regulator FixJ